MEFHASLTSNINKVKVVWLYHAELAWIEFFVIYLWWLMSHSLQMHQEILETIIIYICVYDVRIVFLFLDCQLKLFGEIGHCTVTKIINRKTHSCSNSMIIQHHAMYLPLNLRNACVKDKHFSYKKQIDTHLKLCKNVHSFSNSC